MEEFDEKRIIRELKIDAKSVGIPIGAAEIFITHAVKSAKDNLKTRQIITNKDLERAIARELRKYNADLAYVYANRDKII